MLIPVEHQLPGRVEAKDLIVLLESGEFDDWGFVVPTGDAADVPVSEQSTTCAGLNAVIFTEITPYITTSYNAVANKTNVVFMLRAKDHCSGFVGFKDLKVRYTTDPAVRM
jgi:hypothetical protein